MTISTINWDRKLWGVILRTGKHDAKPTLLGTGWLGDFGSGSPYEGEPMRALLFTTRDAARAWCDVENAKYADRDDVCRHWHFSPVRVRERVEVGRR